MWAWMRMRMRMEVGLRMRNVRDNPGRRHHL
jgi:hypothetical protein